MCTEIWEESGKKPPCNTCFPGVHLFNQAAVTIYLDCDNQYLSGPGGVIGLSLEAGEKAMNWHSVARKERPSIWRKVSIIADAVIAEVRREAELKAEEAKRRGK